MSALKGETVHPSFPRLPLFGLSLLILCLASYGGLPRMGWTLPLPAPTWASFHGPLMVSGFLGTLLGVERAVKLGRNWMYLSPLLCVLGSFFILSGVSVPSTGPRLFLAASTLALAVSVEMVLRRHSLDRIVMLMGSAAWFSGNFLWAASAPIPSIILWWADFLVLTLAAERLELGRFFNPSTASKAVFGVASSLCLGGTIWTLSDPLAGTRVASLGMLCLAAWLMVFDAWERNGADKGSVYSVACLHTSYLWLFMGGVLGLVWAPVENGRFYDAFLHTLFLGFVFSLVFGHAPQIFRTVAQRPLVFLKSYWVHFALLDLSLTFRILCDLTGWMALRHWAGMLSAVAVAVFVLNLTAGLCWNPSPDVRKAAVCPPD
jgi:hypothetical protein